MAALVRFAGHAAGYYCFTVAPRITPAQNAALRAWLGHSVTAANLICDTKGRIRSFDLPRLADVVSLEQAFDVAGLTPDVLPAAVETSPVESTQGHIAPAEVIPVENTVPLASPPLAA